MNVALIGHARTPFGGLGGSLATATAEKLGGVALARALERAKVGRDRLQELLLGATLDAGRGSNPAQAILLEGEGNESPCWGATIRAGGASGLEALARIAKGLDAGAAAAAVAADSASRMPYLLPEARAGSRLGGARMIDGAIKDTWEATDEELPASAYASIAARSLGIERDQLAALRARSVERARAASKDELVPAQLPGAKGDTEVKEDDLPGKNPLPAGDVAYSAPLADGAAAVIAAGPGLAKELGHESAPRLIAVERVVLDARRSPTAPAAALASLMKKLGRKAADFRALEVDDSLTAAPFAARAELAIDDERLNPRGGAQAYGHAAGACGLRALVLLLAELSRSGGLGAVAYGAGAGSAIALAVER